MKFIPIAFVAGVEGFMVFLPYSLLLLAVHFSMQRRRLKAVASRSA